MSGMKSLDTDTQSRNRIVSDINTNFFVEAGAGSGKTTMLVNRMAAMVESGIPVGKICAITFTKAAAGEFYDRFQKLLIERSNPEYVWEDKGYAGQLPEPTDETRKLCAEALQKIDLCFMGTIDSFCGMILSEHPSEGHIPSDAAIVSDSDAESIYKQQYVKICSGEYGPELARMSDVFRAFHRNAEDVFVQGESIIMNNRNVHFNYAPPAATDIDSEFASDRNRLIRALKCLRAHPELRYDREKKSVAAWDRLEDIYRNLSRRWSSNINNVEYALKDLANLRLVSGVPDSCKNELDGLFEPQGAYGQCLGCTVSNEEGVYTKLGKLKYSVSMAFLEACKPVLENAMRDKGTLTFFDYLYYLREMLRRDAEGDGRLINYIYNRHSHFLIDEFQDTNPMQAEIFFYLSSEHPVPQWSACIPRPGSLFIVGDPKQSIYRFRSADVASFLKVKGLFEQNGGAILSLSKNFRSTSVLCEYFNRCFTAMLPDETRDQSRFEEIPVPDARPDEFQGVYTYRAYIEKLEDAYPDKTDPVQIANIIDELVDNDAYLIRTGDDKEPRRIRYSDIMVITYGKKKLGPIMAYLDVLGIPARVEGEVPFGANEALLEIYKIYSAAADADDEIALYGALTGRLTGLTKEEILAYRAKGKRVSLKSGSDVSDCDDDTVRLVASEIEALKNLSYSARRLSPAALFECILDSYRVYETARAENLEVVYYTLELLRNAEKSGLIVSLKDGAAYIAKLLAGESGEERCLSLNDGRDAVHMANLHKVKGLEAPVVILAATKKFFNSSNIRIIHGDTGSEGYLFSLPKKGEYASHFETKEYEAMHTEEDQAGTEEIKRLVYVAATRARNALVICDSMTLYYGKEVLMSGWSPIMQDDVQDFFEAAGGGAAVIHEKGEPVDSAALYDEAEQTCALNDRASETCTYTVENPSRLHLSSKMADDQDTDIVIMPEGEIAANARDSDEGSTGQAPETEGADPGSGSAPDDKPAKDSASHIFPALLGTMTHKLMEMLVSAKNRVDIDDAVSEIIREYLTPVIKPYEKKLAVALSDVARKMRSGGYPQSNGLPQDILGTLLGADEVYCEVPFCYSEDGDDGRILWNGVMDVIYLSGGRWHIVDYKTNADGSDLDRKYRAQLSAYIKAFKATTGEDADALTYHIDI